MNRKKHSRKYMNRNERLRKYRRIRGLSLYDTRMHVEILNKLEREKLIAYQEQNKVMAYIGGDRSTTVTVESVGIINAHNYELYRDKVLYPKLRKTSRIIRKCKRRKRHLRNYEPTAKELRFIFGDISDYILKFLFES